MNNMCACVCVCVCVRARAKLPQLCLTLCDPMDIITHQTPLSMGFSQQEYCNGLPCSPPEDLPNPRIKPASLTSPALAGRFLTTSTTWEAQNNVCFLVIVALGFSW